MNTIWIVMPILIALMFLLGIDINKKAFTDIAHNPKPILLGLIGQLVILPVIAFSIAWLLKRRAICYSDCIEQHNNSFHSSCYHGVCH